MHSGQELGAALKEAMRLKGVRQKDVAAEFGIKQPSVSEWVKFGRIDKAHISHLMAYFADVAGPAHWGLPESAAATAGTYSAEALQIAALYDQAKPETRKYIRAVAMAAQVDNDTDAKPLTEGLPGPAAKPAPAPLR